MSLMAVELYFDSMGATDTVNEMQLASNCEEGPHRGRRRRRRLSDAAVSVNQQLVTRYVSYFVDLLFVVFVMSPSNKQTIAKINLAIWFNSNQSNSFHY